MAILAFLALQADINIACSTKADMLSMQARAI